MADEIGLETKTPHTHLYLHLKTPAKFSRIKNLFPTAHIERAQGSANENRDYIEKSGKWANDPKADTRVDGTFEEWGELPDEPSPGHRSDIAELYDDIINGLSNAEIMQKNPDSAKYISLMDRIRQSELEERFRDSFRDVEVTYIFGPTATGKTRGVLEKHGYKDVYRITEYKHPFDSYQQEPVMCFDEFRSSILISEMLNYLDGYPLNLPARYSNKAACYETVYIISNIDLRKQYPNVQLEEKETWKAFLRRIDHVIEYKDIDDEPIHHGSGLDYIFPPPPPQKFVEVPIDDNDIPFYQQKLI